VQAEAGPVQVSLSIDSPGRLVETNLDRLFQLPRGGVQGEELFLARASIEADGGRLLLVEREGRLVATFSWPRPATREPGAPA